MTSALLLVRTPFQGFLASKVLKAEAVDTFDLLYFTQHDVAEDRHYYGQLAASARNAAYCYARPRRFDVLAHIDFLWQARRWVTNHGRDLLLMASIDSYVLAAIAGRQKSTELVTFDDGTGNYNLHSLYHIDRSNRRGRLYRSLLDAPSADDLKHRIARHYTLHPQFENIAPKQKLRGIDTKEKEDLYRDGQAMTFFIGQPLVEILTPEQIDRFAARARNWPIDFYVKHPRETKPLDLGAPLLDKGGLIAEDAIMRAAGARPIHLLGGFSSVFFNTGNEVVRKTMILFEEMPSFDANARLAGAIGCEVVKA